MKLKLIAVLSLQIFALTIFGQRKERFIAVTFDDLPVVSTRADLKNRQQITRRLLAHITAAKIPAIGFVNEKGLYAGDRRDEAQIDLLRRWLKANLELGNHTFSHRSLNAAGLEEYKNEILRGEIITKELLAANGKQIRYFRHPYLNTGASLEIKNELNRFLAQRGYTVAPVTMDDEDPLFSLAYDNAFDRNDKKLMKRIGAAYISYLASCANYWERQSIKLFGREIKFIILLHANFINSDYFDDVAEMLKSRGYKFVTLENALRDDAYKLPDIWVERAGISWLPRWAIAQGKGNILSDEPKIPGFVLKAAGVDSK